MGDTPQSDGWRRHGALQFFAALMPLVALKAGLTIHRAVEVWDFESPVVAVSKLLLVLGGDVASAAVLAMLAVGILAATGARRPGAQLALTAPLHLLNGAFAALSTLCVVELGGPVNKQFIDGALEVLSHWSGSMAASSADYFGLGPILVVGASALSGVCVIWLGQGRLRGWPRVAEPARLRRRVAGVLLAEVVLTLLLVPPLARGELVGRLRTDALEATPWAQLLWSYAHPALREWTTAPAAVSTGFRFDLRSELPDTAVPVTTVLADAVPQRTNVLLILMESIGAPYERDSSNPLPTLRRLADDPDAVTFDAHYATWSLTTQVLFSILCSELPYPSAEASAYTNPNLPCVTLSERLHDAGYHTAFITPGFLNFDRVHQFLSARKFDEIVDADTLPGAQNAWRGAWGVEDALAVPQVLASARAAGDKPFFIVFNQVAGHHPFLATEEQEKHPKADRFENYLDALRVADAATQAAIDGLRDAGLLDKTLVLIVSDHGEGHGRLAGRNVYQPVVQVPFALFGPQTRGHGGHVHVTTSQIDLAPTVLGLLGIAPPCTAKGRDLTRPVERRLSIFGGRPPHFQLGLADGHWKYILEDGDTDMLFDLDRDPDELENLAATTPSVTADYRRRIEAWQFQSADLIENYGTRMAEAACVPSE